MMIGDYQSWMIVQDKIEVYDKSPAFVCCDRRQHLLKFNYQANKNASSSSVASTISVSDFPNTNPSRSTQTVDVEIAISLERIQYIQRSGVGTPRRSARNYNQRSLQHPHDREQKQFEIYYSTDHPRSEYLYKRISFQLNKPVEDCDNWINALYVVIDEAKTLDETKQRNRWLLREYEKLKKSKGLTFDSINGWLNSHIGLVGEKKNVEKQIKQHEIFRQSNEITDSVFKAVYNYFYDKQQEVLIKILMSDLIEENRIILEKFALRLKNNIDNPDPQEIDNIRKLLRLDHNQTEIPLKQCINYLWSDANSAFDPISRTQCTQAMNQPLNHYWISTSHNTYLAKTQLFNPASAHCYIQALLKGCRCVEIDVVDNRSGTEPEVTHKNTRVKPIPLREVLEAIQDYAFVTSEYPIIISIENHCSPEQRYSMAHMFIEILGENLLQSPLSPNETYLPSPDQLKRKILLKDSKLNTILMMGSQTSVDGEDQDTPSPGLEGHVQLYDFSKKIWLQYNYSFKEDCLYLAKDHEIQKRQNADEDSSDDEHEERLPNDELTQIWYHRNMSHQDAVVLLSNATYEVGTFLVRKSVNKNCYCITFLASNSEVKSIEIRETRDEDGKCLYSLSQKKFDSILDLVSHYRTYDFVQVTNGLTETLVYRLGRPLPRETWHQELERQPWYQPKLTREQAEELLSGIREEMTFLIRESSSRDRQDYTISVYSNGQIRHSPIYRDGSDLMLMSLTFTSLIELVNHFSRKPIFRKSTLQKPAKTYAEFLTEQRHYESQGINTNIMTSKPLDHDISVKVDTLRALHIKENQSDRSVDIQLCVYEEDKKGRNGYLLKFDSMKDCNVFLTKISPVPPALTNRTLDEMTSMEKTPTKTAINTALVQQSQISVAEFNKLIIYCQGVKLKENNINKAQDLLDKIRSFKEMISLNYVKAGLFCSDMKAMIQFNQGHFTRVYPDFSHRSWSSYNFEPHLYWLTGCQMIALNFQMPDRPMHINAGRFAANGGCGYVLMPNYIRSSDMHKGKVETTSMLLKIRVVAVRHLRTIQAKSILKVQVKTTIINKQKPGENSTCSTTINGPCGIWDSKQSSKHHDQFHAYNRFQSDDSDVDLLYFEVFTDNQEFCGQSAIPLSSLRKGIRSVQLYDKFNERLDMSAILVDIHFEAAVTIRWFKQHQSDSQQYYHHHPHHHSDSSRSSSISSSSLSPKTSSSTAAATTTTSTVAAVPTVTVTATLTEIDPLLAQHVEYELGLTKKNGSGSGSGTRKNAWGNLSYAELISKAISSSAEQRLTLSEIYDWMIKYVPFFRNKVDRISSAGWKNSIRHNLSLHNRFKRVQSEGTGKSSWWMINPDDKTTTGNGTSSSTGIKQPRRRLGQGVKSSSLSSTTTQKRLRAPRTTKISRALTTTQQHQTSATQQVQPPDMSVTSVYETPQWASQLEADNATNQLYEQEIYSTSVNTPVTNSNGNSTACIQSTYPYDDVTSNYISNISTNNNNNNTGDYSYHHPHHFHPHHSHTLYQHHHGSNYDTGSSSGYYHQQPVLNDHPCSLPIDTYHTNNPGTYALQQQQQQQQIDPNDEQIYLRVHSTSSHSSSASLSPPTLTTTNTLLPSTSSGSSSSNYTHPHKSSSSGGYLHPASNGTLTLYSHHHQHLLRHPNLHHPDIETLLQLNTEDDDIDDDDDLSTLVHHHGMIDDQQQLSSFFPNHNHPLHSHNDASASILRTVLKRPIVDVYNQQV